MSRCRNLSTSSAGAAESVTMARAAGDAWCTAYALWIYAAVALHVEHDAVRALASKLRPWSEDRAARAPPGVTGDGMTNDADRAFFRAEVERLMDRLYGTALRLTGNAADALENGRMLLRLGWPFRLHVRQRLECRIPCGDCRCLIAEGVSSVA